MPFCRLFLALCLLVSCTSVPKSSVTQQEDKNAKLTEMADSFRESGNITAANLQYDQILKENPSYLPALEGKALSELYLGNIDKSLVALQGILQQDNTRWRSLNAIAIIYTVKGQTDEADSYYQKALQYSNNNLSIINNIALSKAINGNPAGGAEFLEAALILQPDTNKNRQLLDNNLAMLYGIAGKMDKAEKILRKYFKEQEVYNNLGFYAKISKNNNLAKEYFEKSMASGGGYEKANENIKFLEGVVEPAAGAGDVTGAVSNISNQHPEGARTHKNVNIKVKRKGKVPRPYFKP